MNIPMQQSLFDDNNIPGKKNELIISAKKAGRLNPEQVAFNKLVKKIEKIRSQIEKSTADFDEKLAKYGQDIHPLEEELNANKKEVIRLLYPFFTKNKAIKGKFKQTLKRFLQSLFGPVISAEKDKPDADMQEMYQKVFGRSYEKAAAREFEEMKEGWKSFFEGEGYDINLDEIKEGMSEAEIAGKFKEFSETIEGRNANQTSQKSQQKKTARQLDKEMKEKQMEEARNKNVNSIYRQLAKVLHPDLEQDETLKLQKHVLMQRLTVAHKNNDLHALLILEMEWIQKEENNIEQLSREKLAIYNQVLKEQIKDLETQKYDLPMHPKYFPLMRYSDDFNLHRLNITGIKSDLSSVIKMMKTSIQQLKGKGALQEVRNIIHEFELSEMEFNLFDDLFDDDEEQWDLW